MLIMNDKYNSNGNINDGGYLKTRKYLIITLIVYSIITLLTFLLLLQNNWRNVKESALNEARMSFQKDIVYRLWASNHGGVYAPISEYTAPNQYLTELERDIETPSGKKLTLINPVYMTKQVFELSLKRFGEKTHISSLNPLNPDNKPDSWEAGALYNLEKKTINEYYSIENIDNSKYLRYIKAMITEESCLKCHSKQGYKLGDIRGGISVSIPLNRHFKFLYKNIAINSAIYVAFYIFGIILIILFIMKISGRFSELKRYDEMIKNSLQEKELLLKEIHHRVKNNMQVIISILSLQKSYIEAESDKSYIDDLKSRVQSMALVHEKLYASTNFSKINFKNYVLELVNFIKYSYNKHYKVEIVYEIEEVFFNIEYSVPLGLIISEITTNAFKYAFKDNTKGELFIKLLRDYSNVFVLNIKDNGPGISDKIDVLNTNSMGLNIINTLVNQISGKLTYKYNNGADFNIIFSYNEEKSTISDQSI